jgi:UDP-glucose 4-epimerase
MLEHLNSIASAPQRVVIIGAGGFIGGTCLERLREESVPVLSLTRKEIDLLEEGATEKLTEHLLPSDALIVVSAKAPVKNNEMLLDNIAMMKSVCDALEQCTVSQVVYISSDAVYADSVPPLTEESSAEPGSLHGVMHLARELMLRNSTTAPLAILRPTLVYGANDPHNGYGPNRFRRLAAEGSEIVLFGEGEERRDHVLVSDIAEITYRTLFHRSQGVLTIATGQVASFREIAEMVVSHFEDPVPIKSSPRQGPMPHDGYRPFDVAATYKAFPDFKYVSVQEGLAKVHAQALK